MSVGRLSHLMAAAMSGAITMRPAKLRNGRLYKIDARDPAHILVLVPDDLTPSEQAEAEEGIDADLREILRRRRRADLVPVAELVDDDGPEDEATGTDDGDTAARDRRARFEIVD